MRKLVLFLALLGGSVLLFGVAAPAASAGNCTALTYNYDGHPGPVWWDGQYAYHPVVGACTGVSAVGFMPYYNATVNNNTYIYDFSHATYHFPSSGGGECWGNPTITACDTYYHVPVWGGGCGAPPFYVGVYTAFRIRSYPGGTWGSWHNLNSANQWIC